MLASMCRSPEAVKNGNPAITASVVSLLSVMFYPYAFRLTAREIGGGRGSHHKYFTKVVRRLPLENYQLAVVFRFCRRAPLAPACRHGFCSHLFSPSQGTRPCFYSQVTQQNTVRNDIRTVSLHPSRLTDNHWHDDRRREVTRNVGPASGGPKGRYASSINN